jgi:hypothetical protein
MSRKPIVITATVVFILFGLGLCLRAQNTPVTSGEKEAPLFVLLESIKALQADFKNLRQSQELSSQELSTKLNQVVIKQDQILKELDVIRVRVSRNR